MTEQVEMILDCIRAIRQSGVTSDKAAMNILVAYIACKIGVQGASTESMQLSVYDYLKTGIDVSALQKDMNDWFTDAMEELNLIPHADHKNLKNIRANIMRAIRQCKDKSLCPLFLPPQSGRLMIMTYEKLGDEAIYIGVEPDQLQYRIALVNIKLFKLPALMLNIDPEVYSLSPGSKNWNYINTWDKPSCERMEKA